MYDELLFENLIFVRTPREGIEFYKGLNKERLDNEIELKKNQSKKAKAKLIEYNYLKTIEEKFKIHSVYRSYTTVYTRVLEMSLMMKKKKKVFEFSKIQQTSDSETIEKVFDEMIVKDIKKHKKT